MRPRIAAPLLIVLAVVSFVWMRHPTPLIQPGNASMSAPDFPPTASQTARKPPKQIKFTQNTQPKRLPDIDARQVMPLPPKTRAARDTAAMELGKTIPGVKVEFDEMSGAPRQITAVGRLLTTPDVKAANASAVVRTFVDAHSDVFGHKAAALDEGHAQLTREDVTKHNGMSTLVWQQELDGVPLFNTILKANVTKDKALVTIGSHLLPDPAAASKLSLEERKSLLARPPVSSQDAVLAAAANVGAAVDAATLKNQSLPAGAEQRQSFTATGISDTHASLAWLPQGADDMSLVWDVIVTNTKRSEMYRVLVNSKTKAVMMRRCLTNNLTPATYRVYADTTTLQPLDSPTPMSPSLSTPGTAQGASATRSLITTSALDTTASPNGWINDGGQQTTGNNVDAHLDVDADDVPDLPRPNGGPSRTFDFPLSLSQSPTNYQSAAVTQLFYLNNWMHDRLYQLGFTESAGNFQSNNFARGGEEGDAVQADAQDGSGTNNANFSTPPDGIAGRMQMYVFPGPTPDRDGDLDAEIVLHEYTHGLSNRLVGGGAGISSLQAAGMGEGWSDFYAMSLLSHADDDVNACYAPGAYATKSFFGLAENYYFGIRRYPYSTDLTKNPLTFKDIDPAQASAYMDVPHNPVFGGADSFPNEVHSQGEVWCVTLWEMRANLITKLGYATGNELALQLVTDGMKLAPVDPTFLEARDAILQADMVNNASANVPDIWAAFAKRGMGYSAEAPDTNTTSGVVESYDLPDSLVISPVATLVSRGPVGGAFTPATHTVSLHNAGVATLNWTATSSEPWLLLSSTSGTLVSAATSTLTATLTNRVNLLPAGRHEATITITNTTTGAVQTRLVVVRAGSVDYFTQSFDSEPNDVHHQSFLFTPNGSPDFYSVSRTPITELPSDPEGGDVLFLGDDDSLEYVLPPEQSVSIYDVLAPSFFIGSNGYITLGVSDLRYSQGLGTHFSQARVAGLLCDLAPDSNISTKAFDDHIAVTWSGVSQYGAGNSNTFQIEIFFDGRIRISFLDLDATNGLIGLSRGDGTPDDFVESDFSDYPQKFMQLAIPATATEGDGVLAGQGTLTLGEASTTPVVVTLGSSQPSAVTVPATVTIPANATSTTFNLTIVDDGDLDGVQLSTITASATDYSSPSAVIAVNDNETATLAISAPSSVTEGDALRTGTLTVSPTPVNDVAVTLSSSDTSEITVPSTIFILGGQSSATFPITVKDDHAIDDTQTAVVTAHVGGWTDGTAGINVQDNENRQIVLTVPASMIERSDNLGSVHLSGTLDADLEVTLTSSNPAHLAVSNAIIPAGSTSASFIMTAPANTLTEGTLTASVTASAATFLSDAHNVSILDDDVHHLAIAPIASTQHYGEPFTFTVTARDVNDVLLPAFESTVSLSAGSATMSPTTSGSFANAIWQGQVSVSTLGTGLTITVDDGAGHTATSNAFDVVTGGVHHFEWAAVTGPQTVNVPFAATATAKDAFGNTVTSFSQTAQLSAYSGSPQGSSVVITQIDPNAVDELTFANVSSTSVDVSGWTVSFYDEDVWPGRKTFTIPASTTMAPGSVLTVREGGTAPGELPLFRTGYNISWSSQTNEIVAAMLQDADGKVIDFFCASNALPAQITQPTAIGWRQWTGAPVAAPTNAAHGFIRTGSPDTGTAADWTTGLPLVDGALSPSLTLPFPAPEVALPMIPWSTSAFVNGVWSGNVTMQQGATDAHLRATLNDASGDSNAFAVTSTGSLSITLASTAAEGDAPLSGTVTINAAPVADLTVELSSSDTNTITVPASVTILAGQTTASFTATIPDDALLEGTRTALITASAASLNSGFKAVTVTDNETATLSLSLPSSITEGTTITTASVSLSSAPDAPVTVSLSTASPVVTLPATVTIPAGATSTTFSITIANDDFINAPRTAEVTASAPGFTSANGSFAIADNEPLQIIVDLPAPLNEGTTSPAQIVLGENVETDTTIHLVSANPDRLIVPESVLIPANSSYVFFDVEAVENNLYEPNASIAVTGSATGLTPGATSVLVRNNDAHHFEFAPINTQSPGEVFTVTMTAKDENNQTITSFASDVGLSASGDAGAIGVEPLDVPAWVFTEGVWSGNVWLLDSGLGITLHAVSVSGTGTSNSFNAPHSDALAGFSFDDPPSPQTRDLPFAARMFARSAEGYRITDFNEVALLSVSNLAWEKVGQPFNSMAQDMRAQFIYPASSVGTARTLQTLSLHIAVPADHALPAFTIRLKHTNATTFDGPFSPEWDNTGLTTVYQGTVTADAPGWFTFTLSTPFEYDGTHNLLVDFSFNGTENGAVDSTVLAVPAAMTSLNGIAATSDSTDGDPLTWGATGPMPMATNGQPLIRFDDFVSAVPGFASPAQVTMTQGVWSGQVRVSDYGPFKSLRGAWGEVSGQSNPFDVDVFGTLTMTLPDEGTEGTTLNGTVTIDVSRPEPTLVRLFSTNEAVAVPALPSVTIPAGETSANFSLSLVNDMLLNGDRMVLITARADGFAGTDPMMTDGWLTVHDDDSTLITVTLPATVAEGDELYSEGGTVTLGAPALYDVTVTLSSSDTTELEVTPSIIIPAGQSSAHFEVVVIDDTIADGTQSVTVTAHVDGWTDGTATRDVLDNEAHHFAISTIASPQGAGETIALTITALDALNQPVAHYSGSPLMTSGAVSSSLISFDDFVNGVAHAEARVNSLASDVVLTFSDGIATGSSNPFDVVVGPVRTFTFATIASPQTANVPFSVTVTAKDNADHVVTSFTGTALLSSFEAIVPINPVFPPPIGTTGSFVNGVWTGNVAVQRAASLVQLHASAGNAIGTSNRFAVQASQSITLTLPNTATEGDAPLAGTVSIPAALASDLVLNLASTEWDSITVPATVTILAGQTSASFTATIPDDSLLEGPRTPSVWAAAAGYNSGYQMVIVSDNETAVVSLSAPATLTEGGAAGTATISLSAAPVVPVDVFITNTNWENLLIPGSVIIPAGQTSITVPVEAFDDDLVDGAQVCPLVAHVDGWTDGTASITVNDNESRALQITAPIELTEGAVDTLTVSLSGIAVSDVTVTLSSSQPARLTVPETVVIPMGESSASVSIELAADDVYQANVSAVITANAPTFTTGSATVPLLNDDAHHYTFATVPSPQEAGLPFEITITARAADNSVFPTFAMATLTAHAGTRAVPLDTASVPFFEGVATLSVMALDAGHNVVLEVADAGGQTGTSNAFDVTGVGDGVHFEWDMIDSPQVVGVPFQATITARDSLGYTVSNFDNLDVALSLSENGFEPLSSWHLPLETYLQDARTQSIFTQAEVGDARTLTSLALNVLVPPGMPMTHFTIRVKTIDKSEYGDADMQLWETADWTVVHQSDLTINHAGWVEIPFITPFAYDGFSNLMVDISFNNTATSTSGEVESQWTSAMRTVHSESDSLSGDPLNWNDTNSSPNRTFQRPLIRFSGQGTPPDQNITPRKVTFTNGLWTGMVRALRSGSFTPAAAGDYHFGTGNPVEVISDGALVVTLPASAGEGAGTTSGTVELPVAAASNTTVTLVSSRSDKASPATSTIIIPTGDTSGTFTLNLTDNTLLDGSQPVTITASAPGFDPGAGTISVDDNETATLVVALPTAISEGALSAATGTITVSAAPADDVDVALTSSDTSELTVPASAIIRAGQTSATFAITAVDDFDTDGSQNVTVTAHVANWTDGTGVIAVADDDLHHFSVSSIASPKVAGEPFNITVTARTIDELLITSWAGDVYLSTMSGASTIELLPVSASLVDGTWTGEIAPTIGGTGLTVAVDDFSGHLGASNAFTLQSTALSYFEWSPLPTPVVVNAPVTVTLTARDMWGNLVEGFTGEALMNGSGEQIIVTPPVAGPFINGTWTGDIRIGTVVTNRRLLAFTVDDTMQGSSNLITTTAANLLSLTLPATATEGSAPLAGTLTIATAPASDLTVTLESSATNAVTVPASVVIPAGSTSVPVTVTVVNDTSLEGPQTAQVTAWALNVAAARSQIIVSDDTETATLTLLLPTSVTEGQSAPAFGTVVVSDPVGTAVDVPLISDDTATLTVPTSVRIPAGQTSATFPLTIVNNDYAEATRTVQVSASVAGWTGASGNVQVLDDEAHTITIIGSGELTEAGTEFYEITLGAMSATDVEVTLTSSVPGRLAVPVSVIIPADTLGTMIQVDATDNALADGDQNVLITASASGFSNGTKIVHVVDDEPDHFEFVTVPSPRTAGEAFTVTVRAMNASGQLMTGFYGSAQLTASNTAGAVNVSAEVGNDLWFVNGICTTDVTVNAVADGVRLKAQLGTTDAVGESNAFNVRAGVLDHFEWSTVPSPQTKDVPFTATLTARDIHGYKVPTLNSAVDVYLAEGIGSPAVQTSPVPLGTAAQDARTQCLYRPEEVGPARAIQSLTLHLAAATEVPLRNFTVRLKNAGTLTSFNKVDDQVWIESDWTTVYRQTLAPSPEGMLKLAFTTPFAYDGGLLLVDYSFDNTTPGTGFESVFAVNTGFGDVRVLVGASDSMDGDPLTWTGFSGNLTTFNYLPRAVFDDVSGENGALVTPNRVTLAGGEWTGPLTPRAVFFGGILQAQLGSIAGFSPDPFAVESLGVLTMTVPTSASEGAGLLTGEVTIPAPHATPVVVTLASSSPQITLPSSTAVIPAGSTSVPFRFRAQDDALLNGSRLVTLTARADMYEDGGSDISITDDETATLTVQSSASSYLEGSGFVVFTIHSSRAPDTDVTLSLFSSDAGSLYFLDSPVLPAGETEVVGYAYVTNDTLHNGNRNVTVTAHVEGWSDGSATVLVKDDDASSFLISPIASTQSAGVPFNVTVTAVDADGHTATDFHSSITLSTGHVSPVTSITVPGSAFVNGVWTGTFTINTMGSNVVLSATDAGGMTGVSNAFDVLAGLLHHFAWNTIASPQLLNTPFSTTVTAKDQFNNTVAGFTGTTSLSIGGSGGGTVVSGTGTNTWEFPLYTFFHDARTQMIFVPSEVGAARSLTSLDLDVASLPGQTMNAFTIRMKHTTKANYSTSATWDSTGWTTVYQANQTISTTGWKTFTFTTPFAYDGTSNLMVDICFNNTSWSSTGVVRATSTATPRSIYFYTDSGAGDPLTWSGTSPSPGTSTMLPNIRFTGGSPSLPVTPTSTGAFVAGVWTGDVSVGATGTAVITATNATSGKTGTSNSFSVVSLGALSLTAPASASETAGTVTGTVSLPASATANVVVSLASSVTSAATVPATVTIIAGQSSASFPITIVDDALLDGSQTTVITASAPAASSNGTASLIVTDNEVGTLTVSLPATAAENAGALTNQGTISVTPTPQYAVTINLSSTDTSELTVPATVTIPAGASSVTFTPTAVDDTVIDGTRAVNVSASFGSWTSGSATMNITDNESHAISLSLSPTSGIEGNSVNGTLSLAANVEFTTFFTLASSSTADATAPLNVSVPAGSSSVPFTVTVINDTLYEGNETVTITASAATFTNGTANYTIIDNDPHHFAFNTIASPKSQNTPFSVTITAQDASNAPLTTYIGPATLSAAAGASAVTMTPATTGSFVSGVWTGNVTVTQAATGVALTVSSGSATGTSNTFDVASNGVHHFSVSNPASQGVGQAFNISMVALTSAGDIATSFTGPVTISAVANGTPLTISPNVSGTFSGGTANINCTIWQPGTNVIITVNDGAGHTGTSTAMTILGNASRFDVSAIPSSVVSGTATSVTITAKDSTGTTDTTFTGTANLVAQAPGIGQLMIGKGSVTSASVLNAGFHDCRTQTIYTAAQMGGRAARLTAMALNISSASSTVLNSFTVRLRHSTKISYSTGGFAWETTAWTTCYTANQTFSTTGWTTLNFATPFDYNGTDSLMVDVSFDNTTTGTLAQVRADVADTSMMLSGTSNSTNGAPMSWSGSGPPSPGGIASQPQVRFTMLGGVTLSTLATGTFTAGAWTGNLTFTGAAKDLALVVMDSIGRTGVSNRFTLTPAAVAATAEPTYTGGTTNTINWSANSSATSYDLQAATSNTFASPVWNSSPTGTSDTVTSLAHNTLYYYRARAVQSVPHGADAWSQTEWGDFASDTRSSTSADLIPGSASLAASQFTSSTATENFDALTGGAWSSLFSVTGGNVGFALTSSPLSAGPNTTPELPINQGTDNEGRMAGSFVWSLTSATASNTFSDGYIDAYVCAETPAANFQGGVMIRASVPAGASAPVGYLANLSYSTATTASIILSESGSGSLAASSSFAVSTADIIHLRLAAKGPKLTVSAWRVAISGGVVTETSVASFSAIDTRYTTGRAGLRAFPGSGAFLVENINVNVERSVFATSGTITSPAISPSVRSQWGTLNYTSDVSGAGTSLTVDVLDGSNAVLATSVSSGTNLNGLGAVAAASTIKLRANLATSDTTNTPLLNDWSVGYTALPSQSTASAWSNTVQSTQDSQGPVINSTPPTYATSLPFVLTGTGSDTPSGISGISAGPLATSSDGFATWSVSFSSLSPGLNTFTITGGDNATPPNTTTITRSVTYVPPPTLTTVAASSITATGATLNATLNPNGSTNTAQFQYGLTTSYGSSASITLSPNNGMTAQNVSAAITGLTPGATYHFRVSSSTVAGTYNGSDLTFTTPASPNADLTALSLSSGTLTPVFASGTTAYTSSVANAVSSVTVSATRADSNATAQARVNSGTYGALSNALSLNVGVNTIDVRVTAQDGTTTRIYTVTVTRNTVLQDWQQTNTVSNLSGDDDGDGILNLAEFAFNLNPHGANASPTGSSTAINPGDGETYFMFTYPRRIVAAGLTYTVIVSNDMVNWSTPPGQVTEVGATPTGDGVTETVSVRIGPAISSSNPYRFVEVSVSSP